MCMYINISKQMLRSIQRTLFCCFQQWEGESVIEEDVISGICAEPGQRQDW